MTRNYEVYLELDKAGLENKYVVIVNGKVVAKVPEERMLII